jgi:hypothetical protein
VSASQRDRHRAQARPDLDQALARLGCDRLDDVVDDVDGRQEMLAEALAGDVRHPMLALRPAVRGTR